MIMNSTPNEIQFMIIMILKLFIIKKSIINKNFMVSLIELT